MAIGKTYDIRLTPTMLNAYSYWQQAIGEEWEDNAYSALIQSLSHVSGAPSPDADRGTALNQVLDQYLMTGHAPIEKDDCWADVVGGAIYSFEPELVKHLAAIVRQYDAGSVQHYCATHFTTPAGVRVKLYGYADYVGLTTVIDLKSTKNYAFGKYRHGWQHIVYPLALMREGMLDYRTYEGFTYLVAEVDKDADDIITGNVYTEDYTEDLGEMLRRLNDYLDTEMLPFIMQHRDELISNYIFE